MKLRVPFLGFLIFVGGGAQAQVAPAPIPAPAVAPAPLSSKVAEVAARSAFDKLESARLATAANTHERAVAAENAATAAAQVGWAMFDAGRFDEASTWFARRPALLQESYSASKAALNAQLVEFEAMGKKMVDSAKTEADRAIFINMAGSLQIGVLTNLQMLARENSDTTTLLEVSRRKLALTQEQLGLASKAAPTALTQKDLTTKTLAVAAALEDVGSAQKDLAQWAEAEKSFAQVQAMRRAYPPSTPGRNLAESLREMAVLRDAQGDLNGARRFYEQSLVVRAEEEPARRLDIESFNPENRPIALANDGISEVMILNNLGVIASNMGDFKASQTYYDRAHLSAEGLPQEGIAGRFRLQFIAITEANIAALHADQGMIEKARGEMEAAIQIQRQVGDADHAATGLANLSGLLYEKGDLETSRRYLEQARQLAVTKQDLPKVVNFTLSMGIILKEMNRLPEAVRMVEEALPLARKLDNWDLKGTATRTLASMRLAQNKPDDAQVLLEEATISDKKFGSPQSSASTIELQGQVREAKGDLTGAVTLYKQAVTLIEGVRSTASSENAFAAVKSNSKAYERLVQALIKLGRGEEAFDYLSRSRSKQLQEALRVESLKSGNPTLQALFEKAGSLDVRTRTIQGQLQAEQAKPDDQRDTGKIQALQTLVATTQGEWRKTVEQIKATNPSYEKLFTVKPLALSKTQPNIPLDTAFIEYVPLKTSETGEAELTIFLVTRESLKIYTPHVKVTDLWTRIRAVRRQIASRQDATLRGVKGNAVSDIIGRDLGAPTTPQPGEIPGEPSLSDNLVALNEMLITPIEKDIASKKLLAFIPSQLLYYLPMQALAKRQGDDLHFLIEDKEVVYLTEADVMQVVQTPRTGKATEGMVAFGDPVGANLPSAKQEVQTIAQILPGSTSFDGAQVTKTSVTAPGNLNRRVLHFATHGVLDPSTPAHSYILLSPGAAPSDQQLTVGEVWDLPLQKVDLVTLSACNTALGEREPDGTELTTLAEAFSSAGASTVLASLWSVSDDSTKDLMVEFYRQLAAGKSKSAALRAAELSVMKMPGYRHPYFWAPFILMGDWR